MANILNIFNDYPKGYDLTLVNTIYHKPQKINDTWRNPCLTMIAKDNHTGEKVKCEIVNPEYIFYIAKDDVEVPYHLEYIERNKVNPVRCSYGNILKVIADLTDNKEFFNTNRRDGNYKANNMLHASNKVFFSDMNIEDHYRFWFSKIFKNEVKKVTKGFLDIEIDVIDIVGDFPEPGEAPISVLTYIFEDNIYTYVLRNSDNKLVQEFENICYEPKFIDEMHNLIKDVVGGEESLNKYNINNMNLNIMFYDLEILLLMDLFKQINNDRPDFLLAWNMAFDIPYIIERIKVLGYRPEDIMCDSDFMYKEAWYYIDDRMANAYEQRGDYACIDSYTVYLDQMIQFASRRKGQSAFASFKLDDIGEQICGVKKLDYKHITTDIAKLPYLDFKTYVMYNIIDVIVQICIEANTDDIGYIYNSSIDNNTRYSKVHRQTVYLSNKMASYYYDDGYIIGNNINKFGDKPTGKYAGAFVADPNLTTDNSKMMVNGRSVMLFNNLVDFDFTSLYPSIMREFNMSASKQLGKIIINDTDSYGEKVDDGGLFIEDLISHDYLSFGHKWLGLPSFEEMNREITSLFSSGRVELTQPFKVYKNGTIVDPVKTEYTEIIPALIKRSPVNVMIRTKPIPKENKDDISAED